MSREQDRIFIRNFIAIIVVLAITSVGFALIAASLYQGDVEAQQALAEARAERNLQPVAEVRVSGEAAPEVAKAEQASAGGGEARSGEQVAQTVCAACHSGGFMNAPAMDDADAWAPRIEAGLATLVKHVMDGYGNMPPQSAAASEEEIRKAVVWMIEKQAGLTIPE